MDSTPEQLRFASIPGCTIRADFAGGGLSSDLGPLLLKGVDRQIGLTERVCAAIDDARHPGYITHSLHDILKQRIYQRSPPDTRTATTATACAMIRCFAWA